MTIKIKKGDTVKILAGKDRGKTGTILRVVPKTSKVVVEGINMIKKHTRPKKSAPQGGIISLPAPMPVAKVMAICPRCQKAARSLMTIDADGNRHRTCRACREVWPTKE